MNIRFDRVEIENFRSIQKAQVDLTNQGIVVVKGINEYEDNATSNGSGKSSLFEAIIFALFDETSSGEKDVANRIINKGYVVNLYFSVNSDEYFISRQSSGSKQTVIIHKNGKDISARTKTDTNKLILSILGINKSIFLDSIFLSQSANTNLSTLTPSARKERLEILTNTEYTINKFKDELKQLQVKYEANCIKAQMEMTRLDGKLESLNNQKADIEAKIDGIKQENNRILGLGNLEEVENQISLEEANLEETVKNIENLESKISQLEQEINEIRSGEDEINLKVQEHENTKNDLQVEFSKHETIIKEQKVLIDMKTKAINKLNKDIANVKNSDTCPTCGRKYTDVNEEHIQKVIAEYQSEINKYNSEIDEHNKVILNELANQEDITVQLMSIQETISDIKQGITDIRNKVNVKESDKSKVKNDILQEKQTQNRIQSNLTMLRNKKEELLKVQIKDTTEFENMLAKIQEEFIDIDAKKLDYKSELDTYNEYVGVIKNSIQLVTKEFRTYLLQNSLKYLNKLLSIYSRELFSNDKDVISINGDDAKLDIVLGDATYESLSGGEKTRVNIALLLAQKSLANMIGNISCNIIILDEILGYCDSQAESNVIDLITKELDNLESIYMVSHKEIPIGYDTQLIIVKGKDGLSKVKNH